MNELFKELKSEIQKHINQDIDNKKVKRIIIRHLEIAFSMGQYNILDKLEDFMSGEPKDA